MTTKAPTPESPTTSSPTPPVSETGDFPVVLTAKAIEKILEAMKLEGEQTGKTYLGVRVSVVGGGCSGFQYGLDFVEETDEDDLVSDQGGARIFCDSFSASYLGGTKLDYIETLQGAGFKFDNPNARRTCGCGSSFTV